MATDVMQERVEQEVNSDSILDERKRRVELSVQQIIRNARSAPAPSRGAWALGVTAGLLTWASFPPLDWGALGWLGLVPFILLIRLIRPTRFMYSSIYVGGLLFTIPSLQWMRLGDPYMYICWAALALYFAAYFPIFVACSRVCVHRLGLPVVAVVPTVWVGLEYARAHLFTGFSWYYLGHTQYWWTSLIQISDTFGAYGVSFLVAMISASLGMLVPESWFKKLSLFPVAPSGTVDQENELQNSELTQKFVGKDLDKKVISSILISITLFACALGYGAFRRSQDVFTAGPRVAMIQTNTVASLQVPTDPPAKIFGDLNMLTGKAVQHQPDLIVWPEGMFYWPLMSHPISFSDQELAAAYPGITPKEWRDPSVQQTLDAMSKRANAAMIIGMNRIDLSAETKQANRYNSAVMIDPKKGITNEYDKNHLVPFGEYNPFSDFGSFLLGRISHSPDFGFMYGESPSTFTYKDWQFSPIICFEDTVPHIVRQAALGNEDDGETEKAKPIDVLVTITNDGWFHGSSEHDQHLISSLFRAVELRKPLVRAANMGISTVIDSEGVIREPEVFIDGDVAKDSPDRKTSIRDPKTGKLHRKFKGALIVDVPLDSRQSLYLQWGDWFSGSCCLFMLLGTVLGLIIPARNSKPRSKST